MKRRSTTGWSTGPGPARTASAPSTGSAPCPGARRPRPPTAPRPPWSVSASNPGHGPRSWRGTRSTTCCSTTPRPRPASCSSRSTPRAAAPEWAHVVTDAGATVVIADTAHVPALDALRGRPVRGAPRSCPCDGPRRGRCRKSARRMGPRRARRRRLSALHERHDRAAQGRDAHAPQRARHRPAERALLTGCRRTSVAGAAPARHVVRGDRTGAHHQPLLRRRDVRHPRPLATSSRCWTLDEDAHVHAVLVPVAPCGCCTHRRRGRRPRRLALAAVGAPLGLARRPGQAARPGRGRRPPVRRRLRDDRELGRARHGDDREPTSCRGSGALDLLRVRRPRGAGVPSWRSWTPRARRCLTTARRSGRSRSARPRSWTATGGCRTRRPTCCATVPTGRATLGCLDPAGYLYVADRRTDLIVSGGMNVYPSEVEACIGALPGVADCAVVGAPHERWGETVVAVIVPEPEPTSPRPG